MKPIILTAGITLSPQTVLALAAAHIAQFAERLELKAVGTRLDDCRYYLALWREIRSLVTRGLELSSEHTQELFDAATSGDHDTLLTPEEFRAVNRKPARAS